MLLTIPGDSDGHMTSEAVSASEKYQRFFLCHASWASVASAEPIQLHDTLFPLLSIHFDYSLHFLIFLVFSILGESCPPPIPRDGRLKLLVLEASLCVPFNAL